MLRTTDGIRLIKRTCAVHDRRGRFISILGHCEVDSVDASTDG
jgi:hypothetical protein